MFYKYFILVCDWSFDFFKVVSWSAKDLNFNKAQFIHFLWLLFWNHKDFTKFFRDFSPMFSPKSFIVLALTLKTLIHFELMFMYDVRERSKVIQLHIDIPSLSPYCCKDYHVSTQLSCYLSWKSIDHKYKVLFLNSQVCSNNIYAHLDANTTLPWLLKVFSKLCNRVA